MFCISEDLGRDFARKILLDKLEILYLTFDYLVDDSGII